MNVIMLTVKFDKLTFKVIAYLRKDSFQIVEYWFCEDFSPVFSNKHQMYMHQECTVSSSS